MSHLLEVQNLSYQYGSRKALQELTFSVEKGEIFGFLGPNGGGKTTTFKILSTLFSTQPGQVKIFGMDLAQNKIAIRRRMGIVFQLPALDKKLKVRENLVHQGHLYGLSGKELQGRIERDLERLNLKDRVNEKVESLSGGLQRRVELAKALLNNPELMILDEPSTGLDPAARKEFWGHLESLRQSQGMTVLVTTHYLEEADRCDRLLILDKGVKVALGKPETLKAEIGGEVLRLKSKEPSVLAVKLMEKLKIKTQIVGDLIQIEQPKAYHLVAPILESFPDDVLSLTLGLPTLEDVFIHQTGRRFAEDKE
ncbi:MAG TPA: ABC transporter ATP-binding protein [bacterium]|jgi:ABC-2 type transport system ATP-binding protein|nr:ABC transporter ATP-binding protein [bacterium]